VPDEVAERLAAIARPRLRPIITSANNQVLQEIPIPTPVLNGQTPHLSHQAAPLLGQAYRHGNEQLAPTEYKEVFRDPEQQVRGNRAHAQLQNQLAHLLENRGIAPKSPYGESPNFDIAWQVDGIVYVAEMKSLTRDNEEMQLRLGLGQVLMYRHLLAQHYPIVRAILVVEHEPTSRAWQNHCDELDVLLVWPQVIEETLQTHQTLGPLPY